MGADKEGKAPTVYIETLLVVRPIKVIGLMCGIIAVLLLMLSIAATSWLRADDVREGLWERCTYNYTMTEPNWLDCELGRATEWMTACQALCLMSLITCVIAIIITSVALRNTNFKIKYKLYWAGLITFLVAVLFELISLIIFPVKFLDDISTREQYHWSFGWAYIVGWVGAVAEFAAGLFLLLDRGAEEIIYRERVLHEENGIEASEDV
ncbi:lens fiber membrane intrinsic protein [Plakobranchus ocellatus]|uniref:Lens fiber membrane intrinsic protein n=1 Tax=Plakobranchus ocellatus TaxID=259542 RepID=A0AAV4CRD3_9GAST|nr:lens fiber membrane intrinsic protein [Plakobranchus ocellatus]